MYSLLNVLNIADAYRDGFGSCPSLDVVDFADGLCALSETSDPVDGVCRHCDHLVILQLFAGSLQCLMIV